MADTGTALTLLVVEAAAELALALFELEAAGALALLDLPAEQPLGPRPF